MRWLKPISLRARSRSGVTLIEVVVAAVLTVIIGYVVITVAFSAGQGLTSQEASVNAHHQLDATLTGMETELHNAQVPLAEVQGNEILFVAPGPTSGYEECVLYVAVANQSGPGFTLYQQSKPVKISSGEESASDTAKACKEEKEEFHAPSGSGLLTNLASDTKIFTPVKKVPTLEELQKEEYQEEEKPVGAVVNLSVSPAGATGLSAINQKTFVEFQSAHVNE